MCFQRRSIVFGLFLALWVAKAQAEPIKDRYAILAEVIVVGVGLEELIPLPTPLVPPGKSGRILIQQGKRRSVIRLAPDGLGPWLRKKLPQGEPEGQHAATIRLRGPAAMHVRVLDPERISVLGAKVGTAWLDVLYANGTQRQYQIATLRPLMAEKNSPLTPRIRMNVGDTKLRHLPPPGLASRNVISISNPEVADFEMLGPSQAELVAKSPGLADLIVRFGGETRHDRIWVADQQGRYPNIMKFGFPDSEEAHAVDSDEDGLVTPQTVAQDQDD